jgi:hypothetical protein
MSTCEKSDRDVPGLVCGYPLPCPHHTAVVMEVRPAGEAPEIRSRVPLPTKTVQRLDQIGRALSPRKCGHRPMLGFVCLLTKGHKGAHLIQRWKWAGAST